MDGWNNDVAHDGDATLPVERSYDVPPKPALWRRLVAEYLGTFFLATTVVGAGIAAQTAFPDSHGLQLLFTAFAVTGGLLAVHLIFGRVSGAHVNPVLSIVDGCTGGLTWSHVVEYVVAQLAGAVSGTLASNAMFSVTASLSTHQRVTVAHMSSEIIATAGLVLLHFVLVLTGRISKSSPAVSVYIGASSLFISSTNVSNPAICIGRMFTNTMTGISPSSVPFFVGAELLGGVLGLGLLVTLYPRRGWTMDLSDPRYR